MNLRDLVRQLLLTSGKSISEATDIKDLERFIEKFRPKSVGKKLIRIGGKGDGAYLLPDDLSSFVILIWVHDKYDNFHSNAL